MKTDNVILSPILTEKATKLAQGKVYMFHVAIDATKFQVKEALEKLYPIKIKKVRIAKRWGKVRRVGKRMKEKRSADKKLAYVKVGDGKIDLFPQV